MSDLEEIPEDGAEAQQDRKVKILAVDDSMENLAALEMMLQSLPVELLKAGSGKEALMCLLGDDVALILMAVHMPDLDGFETASVIRQRDRTRHVPIVFLTACYETDMHMKGYSLGAVDYLNKPIVPEVLQAKVTAFVELFKKTEEVKRQGELLRELQKRVHERQFAEARQQWEAQTARETEDLELQLRQAQKLESLGQLAGGIAHDFNNLLTVILGRSQMLRDKLDPGNPLRREADLIFRTGERAAALTRQLLAFSRKQVLQPRVLDLNTVVIDMEKMLHRVIGEQIELIIVPANDIGQVKADPSQIEQVIMNLAINARDAMPHGGKLTIETADVELDKGFAARHAEVQPGSYVMLAVSDVGWGMTSEIQARIFEPFFTTKEEGKGTGLGLATVYGIVKQTGGNIWVYSEIKRGTTFKIFLPRIDAPVEQLEPDTRWSGSLQGLETILLVEDDVAVRENTEDILRAAGYDILVSRDVEDAKLVSAQHRGPIHLMVTDVVMPRMKGPELARLILSSRPDMKVLFVSGYTTASVTDHGVIESGFAFLQKPFAGDVLLAKVRETLDDERSHTS